MFACGLMKNLPQNSAQGSFPSAVLLHAHPAWCDRWASPWKAPEQSGQGQAPWFRILNPGPTTR